MKTNEATSVREPGIVILRGDPVGILTDYHVKFYRPTGAILCETQRAIGAAAATAWAGLKMKSMGFDAKWITGDGVDKRTSRKFGAKNVERVPGAGRPAKPDGEKFVQIPAEVHPKKLEAIKAAAFANGHSIGQEIASRFT